MSELRPEPGPLAGTHTDARRLGESSEGRPFRRDLLFGTRGIKRPLVALTTKKEMGPARHALAQVAIGGTMVVHPPLRPGEKPPAEKKADTRVLTFTPPPPREQDTPATAPPAPPRPPPRPPPVPPARTLPDGRKVTVERTVIESFTPLPEKDD